MDEMAKALAADLWTRFTTAYPNELKRFQELQAKVQGKTATPDEESDFYGLLNAGSGGYCLAGRVASHGRCQAFEILWGLSLSTPQVTELAQEAPVFWGVPQIMERLVFGFDSPIIAEIIQSGKWTGSREELIDLVLRNQLMSPRLLPIREAIDWVHTVIHTTIRGTKFANWPHWCGGPVELAVITTDRPFRWVRHKSLDAAIITAEEAGQ